MADPLKLKFQATLAALADGSDTDLLAAAMKSPAIHFACFVTIKDKDNKVITPEPNILQLRMSETYETLRDLGVKVRIIVCKPRRAGCSSFSSHIVYHFGQGQPIEGITISDIKAHSKELMDKLDDYAGTDTYPWANPQVSCASHSLAWENGTKWTIDTAENPDAGVGGTRQAGHFSEVSKWPKTATRNDKATMASVLPSLSGMDTVVIAESTPEGAAGWQFDTWQEAVNLDTYLAMRAAGICPENQWVKVFAAWWEFEDNTRATQCSEAEIEMLEGSLSPHERSEIELYKLTWEQVAWRRETIKSDCSGDPKKFQFYYPSDEVSCWLASGRPRFDMAKLVEMEAIAHGENPDTGYLMTQDNTHVSWQPVRDGTGDIIVWEPPKAGLRYVVTCDPAEDITQTIGADPDRHAVGVWRAAYYDSLTERHRPAKKVARLKPPFYGDGDVVAGHVQRLSKWYGDALVALEVNKGMDILRLLRTAGVPLFKRRAFSHRLNETVEQYGFKMGDKEERKALIEGFSAALRSGEVEVLDLHAIAEYKNFIVTPKGRAEAASGKHDDDVIGDAIAWETLPSAHEFKKMVAKHQDPVDRQTWRNVTRKW